MEELLMKLLVENNTMRAKHNAFRTEQNAFRTEQEARMRNLENQFGKMQRSQPERALGTLPSNTENNPRERVQAITLRSGGKLEEVKTPEGDEIGTPSDNEELRKEMKLVLVSCFQLVTTYIHTWVLCA